MSDFKHLLLTRFNVRHGPWQADKHGQAVLTDAWLEHRFGLFDRFCFPSVAAQTNRDFQWLVFFDVATPERFRRRLERYRGFAPFAPEFTTDDRLIDVIRERAAGAATLITTRLDNDDAIHRELIARVQAHLPVRQLELVNFLEGYYVADDRIARVEHACNMFISLLEPAGPAPFRTVWCREHAKLGELGPIRQVTDLPGWIASIHDRNLSNAIRDPHPGTRAMLRRSAGRVWRRLRGSAESRTSGAAARQFSTQLKLADLAADFGFDPGST